METIIAGDEIFDTKYQMNFSINWQLLCSFHCQAIACSLEVTPTARICESAG